MINWYKKRKARKEALKQLAFHLSYRAPSHVTHLLRQYNSGDITPVQLAKLELVLGKDWRTIGVCSLAALWCPGMQYRIDTLFKGWQHYSGDAAYPVLHPFYPDPMLAWQHCKDKWSGEYGAKRLELLDYVLQAASLACANHLNKLQDEQNA